MYEEICQDNNCIVKAFENNPISILQEDNGDKKIHYFKASDIGKALHLSNIAVSIQHYDEDERVIRKAYDTTNREQDTTFLSSQGVYRLLYNSKKVEAKKFRKWAGMILDDIIFNESRDLQRQLEQNKQELEMNKRELEKLKRLKTKRWYDQEPGDTIYAIKVNNIIKIGKTRNIKKREGYYTENQTGDMFYIKQCYNCDLTEKVIHHILDKHREENNKEWFNISNELAIYTIDIVCNFLDNFINTSEKLPLSNIKESIKLAHECINPPCESNIQDDTKNEFVGNVSILNRVVNIQSNEDKIKNFIQEFCELGEDYCVLSYELLGAYRIWSKGLTNGERSEFTKFMKNNYKSKRKYYKEHSESSLATYFGIKPKELIVLQENENVLPKYEEFILSECKFNYNYRTAYKTFIDAYKEWFTRKYPEYSISKQEQFNMDTYINRHFLKEKINMPGYRNVNGIWGFQLKSENTVKLGMIPSIRKEIVKIDCKTRKVTDEYKSMTIASNILKLNRTIIRDFIISKRVVNDDFLLEYKKDVIEI